MKSVLVVVLAPFAVPALAALPSPVVGTGQLTCYDDRSAISCPLPGQPYHGQDAQSGSLEPAYSDNGDGTVSDLRTGLQWVRSPGAKVSWEQARDGAAACREGGHDDWRLPTIRELYSLVLFSGTDVSSCMAPGSTCADPVPFLDTRYFDFAYGDTAAGERVIDAQYWSATPYVSTTMQGVATIFGVNFADGRIKGYPRDRARQFVRYVRGPGYGTSDFVDGGDGTITDRASALTWDAADSGVGLTWAEALAWVEARNAERYRGHDDWRLPDAKELQSLVDYTRSPATTGSAAIDPRFQVSPIVDERGGTNYPFYWTSTTHADADGSGAFAVYVAFGEALGWMQSPATGEWAVLDVHGAGAQRSDPKAGSASSYPHGHGPQGDVVRVRNHVRLVRTASGTER
ncbi:MAG: DUF1566 domain-containing protein [Vicinamibacteria bacterium]|nr:DUF1566 domain-containing protein [Vicinamibacteria bacterium]